MWSCDEWTCWIVSSPLLFCKQFKGCEDEWHSCLAMASDKAARSEAVQKLGTGLYACFEVGHDCFHANIAPPQKAFCHISVFSMLVKFKDVWKIIVLTFHLPDRSINAINIYPIITLFIDYDVNGLLVLNFMMSLNENNPRVMEAAWEYPSIIIVIKNHYSLWVFYAISKSSILLNTNKMWIVSCSRNVCWKMK